MNERSVNRTRRLRFCAALVVALMLVATVASADEEYYLRNRTGYVLYAAQGQGTAGRELQPGLRYRSVPPGGLLPLDPGLELAGFAFERGAFQLPTFGLGPQAIRERMVASATNRSYLEIGPEDLTDDRVVTPTRMTDVLSGVRIDNQYLDWVAGEAVIARGRGRLPLGVYADFGEGREPLGLAESLLWTRGGTDLQWIKGATGSVDFYLAAAAYTPFAERTSLFLYLYEPDGAVPVATLEIPAGRAPGVVLLWVPVLPAPLAAGNVVSDGFYLEAQLWPEVLARTVGTDPWNLTVEFSTASSAAGVWEEFVLGSARLGAVFGR